MAADKYVSPEIQRAADRVIEAGLQITDFTDTIGRGKRSREYFKRLAELLDLYTSPENLVDGNNPQYPLPAIVAKQLGSLCKYLGVGIIPEPIKHCARRGRPLGPDESRDVRYAVIYVLAAKEGLIQDRHPLKTIVDHYGLSSSKTVQTWIAKHGKTMAPERFADPELIKDRMQEAAQRYRVSGRHHKAIRDRASQKTATRRKES